MTKIQVVGICSCCSQTVKLLKKKIDELNINAEISIMDDLKYIAQYNLMNTPAIIIDDVLMYEGSTPPTEDQITTILQNL